MLNGIKLLIERMETNPEEFTGDLSYRWSHIMQDIAKHGQEFLSEEDIFALNMKVKELRRKELDAKIVDEISTGERLKQALDKIEAVKMLKDTAGKTSVNVFGNAPIIKSGSPVSYFTWMDSGDAFDNCRF